VTEESLNVYTMFTFMPHICLDLNLHTEQ